MKKVFFLKLSKKIDFDFAFFKKSFKTLIPVVLSSLIISTVSFVDNIMVNNFQRVNQPKQVDFVAVGIGNEIWFGFQGIFIAITIVFSVLYAQFAKNKKIFVQTARLNFWIFIFFTTLVSLLMFFGADFFTHLFFWFSPGKDASYVKPIAINYLKILSLGAIFFSCSILLMNPLTIKGKTNYLLFLSLVSLILNSVLDYVFIYVLNQGGQGSAWATVISYFVQFLISCFFVFKHCDYFPQFWKIFSLSKFVFKEIFKRWWMFLSFVLMQASFAFSTIIWTNLYSANLIKSISVGYIVSQIMFTVLAGTNRGIKIFIGPLLGEKKFKKVKTRAKQLFYTNVFLGTIFVMLSLISMSFFPQIMLSSATDIKIAKWVILSFSLSFFGYVFTTYFSSIFETSGFQLIPNFLNYFFQVWCPMPLSIILSHVVLSSYGLSFEMNFLIVNLTYYLSSFVLFVLYKRYKWLKRIEK